MGFPVNEDGTLDYTAAAPTPTRLTDGAAEYGKAPAPQRSKCPSCKGSGYIWVTETPDTGHECQMDCPVCNPKIDLYAADRYVSDF